MIKNNKRTIISLLAYTGILIAVIVTFVFVMQVKNSNSVTEIYYATRDIEAGKNVDSAFEMNYIAKIEVPKSVVSDMEKNGAKPIVTTTQLKNSTLSAIPKGTYLIEAMFGDVVTTTIMEGYQKNGYINPYYAVLSVDKTNSPISGFSEGQKISIEGTVALQNVSYDEEFKDVSNEVYTGILTKR